MGSASGWWAKLRKLSYGLKWGRKAFGCKGLLEESRSHAATNCLLAAGGGGGEGEGGKRTCYWLSFKLKGCWGE